MRKRLIIKTASLLLSAAIVLSALMGGVGVLRGQSVSSPGKPSCVLTLDVCGQGLHSLSVQDFEALSNPPCTPAYYYPVISVIPPSPAMAVASAEPGETDKPPEA